ncbi:hypothetical protein [Nodularia spumigena]|uniref:hypothetical protein n=1 Tax=Nodularia spumigena TaxID=70799 RepID=UPI00232E5773|nr:hypothetical protein [Nodularia spumigena]MDB9347411.1 hypothetical protein [Nodularia spumigena CS-588/01]MDB9354457.1 hypothetical protein [Nodularia spumigena CS-588/05]
MISNYKQNYELYNQSQLDKKTVTKILWLLSIALGCFGLLTPNPSETFFGCLVIPILFTLLWRPGEPPILMFAATFQFVQVFTPVIVANIAGQTLQDNTQTQSEINVALYVGIVAIIILAIGMRLGGKQSHRQVFAINNLNLENRLNPQRLITAYIITFFVSNLLKGIAFVNPGFTQLLIAISSFHWFIIYIILYSGMKHSRFRLIAFIIISIETILGFTGFFSSFKTIFFLLLVVYGGTSYKISKLLRPQIMIIVVLILGLTTYWQGVKGEYRNYVNLGTQTQTVQVSLADRLSFHTTAITQINSEKIQIGLESGLKRLGYIGFLAASIKTVPENIPHQNGRLWLESLVHLYPRFLNPDKPVIEDSRRTNEFTGFKVAGAAQGTSISIGYVGESYIDFGIPLMFVPILLLGYLWGWLYRFLCKQGKNNHLLGIAAGTTLILNLAILFESSNIKIVGAAISSTLVYLVFLRFSGDKVWQWLTKGNKVV